jgi:GAF domain-containing protein
MSDAIADFGKIVDALVQSGQPIESPLVIKLAADIGKAFSVRPDEVAILATTPDDKFVRFLVPEQLRNVGTIPINSTSAMVSRTAREKRAEIINNFTTARHSTVFEAVPLESKQRGDPIQKIMSVPVVTDGRVAGVLQVSRKGKTVTTAGADFSPADLNTLNQYAAHLGRCLPLVKVAIG